MPIFSFFKLFPDQAPILHAPLCAELLHLPPNDCHWGQLAKGDQHHVPRNASQRLPRGLKGSSPCGTQDQGHH